MVKIRTIKTRASLLRKLYLKPIDNQLWINSYIYDWELITITKI